MRTWDHRCVIVAEGHGERDIEIYEVHWQDGRIVAWAREVPGCTVAADESMAESIVNAMTVMSKALHRTVLRLDGATLIDTFEMP
jgi:hypothetical protein